MCFSSQKSSKQGRKRGKQQNGLFTYEIYPFLLFFYSLSKLVRKRNKEEEVVMFYKGLLFLPKRNCVSDNGLSSEQ